MRGYHYFHPQEDYKTYNPYNLCCKYHQLKVILLCQSHSLAQAFCHNANSPENEKQEGNAENNQGQPRGCGNGKEEKPQLRKHQHQAEQCSALQETELGSEKQQSTQIIPTFKRWNSEQQATNEKPRPNRSLSERGHIPLGEGSKYSTLHVLLHRTSRKEP